MVDTGTEVDSAAVLVEPWLLTENDLQWLISLGRKRYGSNYDYLTVEGWFRNIVLKAPLMFLPIRLANSFLIAMLNTTPWAPSAFECNVVFVCTDHGHLWEAAKLLRYSIDWARKRKCTAWRLASDTEYDLSAIAKRLGATEISPRFTINM